MNTHNLTTEQVRKFVKAIGGTPTAEIAGGQFTTEELSKLAEQTGGLRDWPKFTGDPLVNFAVDCVVAFGMGEEEPEYDEQLYAKEILASRKTFGPPAI